MNPVRFIEQTRVLGAPPDWDEAKHGPCAGLPIKEETVEGAAALSSYWKPSREDLALLNSGAKVKLVIYGNAHPAVWVAAEFCGELPQ
jgi:hypothetical protein